MSRAPAERRTERASFIEALTAPRAVALIGASDNARKTSARPMGFLQQHGFRGAVYPVNPNRASVLGADAYPDLASLPRDHAPIDHAFVLVPTDAVFDAVEACGAAGVPVVSILADGFAEAGDEGAARQARLMEIARAHDIRILGPNSVGVVNTGISLALTANAAFATEQIPAGRLAVLSHSGNILGTLLTRGAVRGAGFSKMISVGNEADLSIGEIGAALADDPETDAFLLFLESIRRADALADFAARAGRAGKPIIAYLIGRSEAGRDVALSHTGAMVGGDEAADAFFRHHGIVRVDQFETLIELPPLLAGRRPAAKSSGGVSVVATNGGGAGMVADRLGGLGIDVLGPGPETIERLAARGVQVRPGRVIDLTLVGTRYDGVREALGAASEIEGTKVVVAVIGSSAEFEPERAIKPIIDFAHDAGPSATPVAVFIMPRAEASHRLLRAAGIASFRTPESCADAIRAFLDRRAPRPAPRFDGNLEAAEDVLRKANDDSLDEAEAANLFAALGIETAPHAIIAAGDPPPATLPFGFPVAVKILSADLAHKTEAGGVALGIADEPALAAARLAVAGAARDGAVERVLVQRMESGLAEVLLGYRRDSQAGPLVTLGMGGTLAEIYRDFSVRLAPVDEATAHDMIEEVAGLAIVRGYRNLPEGDLAALAGAVAALSRLALLRARSVVEAEINPLIVRRSGLGVVAVDALARLAPNY